MDHCIVAGRKESYGAWDQRGDSMKRIFTVDRLENSHQIVSLLAFIVLGLTVTFCFFASSLCITLLLSTFLSILMDPVVTSLERLRVPRSLSAGILILIGMLAIGLGSYTAYNQFSVFLDSVPASVDRVRIMVAPLNQKIAKVEESAGRLASQPPPKTTQVQVKQPSAWPSYLVRGFGSASSVILVLGVVPFLMYYMLIRKDKWHRIMAGFLGSGVDAAEFTDRLTSIVRGFALGNLTVGAFMSLVTIAVLSILRIQGAVVLGVLSGFLNLIPFLGVVFAAVVPLAAEVMQFSSGTALVIVAMTVILLHAFSSNFVLPRYLGSRMNMGPVAATIGILFWGWLWGIAGVLLAIPLTGTVKLIAESYPSLKRFSEILGEGQSPVQRTATRSARHILSHAPPTEAIE